MKKLFFILMAVAFLAPGTVRAQSDYLNELYEFAAPTRKAEKLAKKSANQALAACRTDTCRKNIKELRNNFAAFADILYKELDAIAQLRAREGDAVKIVFQRNAYEGERAFFSRKAKSKLDSLQAVSELCNNAKKISECRGETRRLAKNIEAGRELSIHLEGVMSPREATDKYDAAVGMILEEFLSDFRNIMEDR